MVEAHDPTKEPQTVNSLTVDYNEPMEIPASASKVGINLLFYPHLSFKGGSQFVGQTRFYWYEWP